METRMKGTDTEAELREMFKVFDMDGNGYISAEEFKWTMMNLGQQLTEEEVEEIIKTADLNGDGQIDLEGISIDCFFKASATSPMGPFRSFPGSPIDSPGELPYKKNRGALRKFLKDTHDVPRLCFVGVAGNQFFFHP